MNKYQSEDYFSVLDKKTGRKLLDCGEELDALAMVAFDSQNRTYTRNQFLMGQVVDIQIPKSLPTNEIVIDTREYQEHQDKWMVDRINELPQIKLPEGQGKPVRV